MKPIKKKVCVIVRRSSLKLHSTWEAETFDQAKTFVNEFNRLEKENPKGCIAFVDKFGLVPKEVPKAKKPRRRKRLAR
jgi:hypothetical protein